MSIFVTGDIHGEIYPRLNREFPELTEIHLVEIKNVICVPALTRVSA